MKTDSEHVFDARTIRTAAPILYARPVLARSLGNDSASIISTMRWTIDHSSAQRLQDQVAASVVCGLNDGELSVGEQLPPAAELAAALSVDRNTVLAAYRQLRDAGVLEFRRGRGARIAATAEPGDLGPVREAVRATIDLARRYGLDTSDVITLVKEMS